MDRNLQSMIVTGASGFVGRHLLEAARGRYRIYAIARRSQREAGVTEHPNITWIQVDIGDWTALKRVMRRVKELGGADYVIHLAAFYNFNLEDHPEYRRTNVNGTRHMLEQAKWLCVRRFVFASSLAACSFGPPKRVIDESSPPDAGHVYAASKAEGEAMCREYSRWFPCSTVRFAAVFSDWCEYAPLYMFLSTWLSRGWRSRILGGRGESGVSYIHRNDLSRLLLTILDRSEVLPAYDTYIASPSGCVTHRTLFEAATRYFWAESPQPILMPKPFAACGIIARDLLGRLVRRRPFERPWMIPFIDQQIKVNSSYTCSELDWQPTSRLHILRRLLFLVENMKRSPDEWRLRNEAILQRDVERPSLRIHEAMVPMRDRVIDRVAQYVRSPENRDGLVRHRRLPGRDLHWYLGQLYSALTASVRTGDRALILSYADEIARRRFEQGFGPEEINTVFREMGRLIVECLVDLPELKGYEQKIHDLVDLTVQLGMDQVEDCWERFSSERPRMVPGEEKAAPAVPSGDHLERMIEHLNAFYEPVDDGSDDGRVAPKGASAPAQGGDR